MVKAPTLPQLARNVLQAARAKGLTIATAESCTGGMVAQSLTAIAGSSDVFDRGFITYSNAAKTAMLGVPSALIAEHGAVSAEVASAMAEGALRALGAFSSEVETTGGLQSIPPSSREENATRQKDVAGLAVAITGIAGPSGGSTAKPVGLVHLAAVSSAGQVDRLERRYDPALGRAGIRKAATRDALEMLMGLMAREALPTYD